MYSRPSVSTRPLARWTSALVLVLGLAAAACSSDSSAPVRVATITVTPQRDTIGTGKSVQLSAVLADQNGDAITGRTPVWTVTPQGIASVSTTGLVTGIDSGSATVTATIDGQSDVVQIEVVDVCSTVLSGTLSVGGSATGELDTTDCRLSDGTYIDGYRLSVQATSDVQIDMTSSEFDTFLLLVVEDTDSLPLVAFNDDIDDNNTDSRLVATLEAGRRYHVLANGFDSNQLGTYTLTVSPGTAAGARAMSDDAAPRRKKGTVVLPSAKSWPPR